MKRYQSYSMTSLLIFFSVSVYSGTLIETKGTDDESAITYIEGNNIRTDAGDGTYVIFDLDNEKAYIVDDSEKMVIDMSEPLLGNNQSSTGMSSKNVNAKHVKQGKGPTIAGYSTTHYKVMAGNMDCGNEYLSSKILDDANLHRFGEVMTKMSRNQEQMMGGMMAMGQDPCDVADRSLSEDYLKKGMSMRSVDKDGMINHEVLSVKTDTSIPAGKFKLPEGYPVMTMEQMMQQHTQMQQEHLRNIPDMSEMQGMDMNDMKKMQDQAQKQIEEMMRQMGKQQNQ